MASSKKSSIPQGKLDSSLCSDRGSWDLVATQDYGFVEGQTCNKFSVSKQLKKAANMSKSKRQKKKAEKRMKKQNELEASIPEPKPI